MFLVELLGRDGHAVEAKCFTRDTAINYFGLAKGSGRIVGGAITQDGLRLTDFGLLRDGATVKEARKLLKK